MASELKIPREYEAAFSRLMRKIPAEAREDETIRKTALLFLKVGGEKLAIASIRALVTPFSEKFILKKMQLSDEDLVPKASADSNTSTGESREGTEGNRTVETGNPQK